MKSLALCSARTVSQRSNDTDHNPCTSHCAKPCGSPACPSPQSLEQSATANCPPSDRPTPAPPRSSKPNSHAIPTPQPLLVQPPKRGAQTQSASPFATPN